MHLSSRTVLGSGQKQIAIHGPFPEMEEELVKEFLGARHCAF